MTDEYLLNKFTLPVVIPIFGITLIGLSTCAVESYKLSSAKAPTTTRNQTIATNRTTTAKVRPPSIPRVETQKPRPLAIAKLPVSKIPIPKSKPRNTQVQRGRFYQTDSAESSRHIRRQDATEWQNVRIAHSGKSAIVTAGQGLCVEFQAVRTDGGIMRLEILDKGGTRRRLSHFVVKGPAKLSVSYPGPGGATFRVRQWPSAGRC